MVLLAALLLLLLALPHQATAALPGKVVYVAPDGSDSASGATVNTPLASCAGAVKKVGDIIMKAGLPAGGVEVQFAAGAYQLTSATACGSVHFSGSAASPIIFRGMGTVLFDATSMLDTEVRTALQQLC